VSDSNVIEFLRTVAVRADVLDSLKVRSKEEVIGAAAGFGFPFTEPEFDSLIWGLEARLAAKRGEKFDQHFSLWETMWGKYYLDYLVTDLIPGLEEAGLLPPGWGTDK
jgi:hypothetical protein